MEKGLEGKRDLRQGSPVAALDRRGTDGELMTEMVRFEVGSNKNSIKGVPNIEPSRTTPRQRFFTTLKAERTWEELGNHLTAPHRATVTWSDSTLLSPHLDPGNRRQRPREAIECSTVGSSPKKSLGRRRKLRSPPANERRREWGTGRRLRRRERAMGNGKEEAEGDEDERATLTDVRIDSFMRICYSIYGYGPARTDVCMLPSNLHGLASTKKVHRLFNSWSLSCIKTPNVIYIGDGLPKKNY